MMVVPKSHARVSYVNGATCVLLCCSHSSHAFIYGQFGTKIQPSSSRQRCSVPKTSLVKMGVVSETTKLNVDDEFYASRFGGISRMYGVAGLHRLREAHVCVLGIGGVGSWAVEALARSGIGALTLIDLDTICVTNINRQIHALTSTVGQTKAEVLRDRVLEISPSCDVKIILDFLSEQNAAELLTTGPNEGDGRFDVVLDAIDSLYEKSAIIDICRKVNMNVVTVGAAGGKADPTKVQVADLSRVEYDMLLFQVRKKLRQLHDFPRGTKRNPKGKKWGVGAVYSSELVQNPAAEEERLGLGGCDSRFGTVTMVTGAFGFIAASIIARMLAQQDTEFQWTPHAMKSLRRVAGGEDKTDSQHYNMDEKDGEGNESSALLKNEEESKSVDFNGDSSAQVLVGSVERDESCSEKGELRVPLFDAHCHLQLMIDSGMDGEAEVRDAKAAGIESAVVCGTNSEDWDTVAALAEQASTAANAG